MKIVVTARTFNEPIEEIRRFCDCYQWADRILLSDGYDRPEVWDQEKTYRNVMVDRFIPKIELPDGTFYNPRGKHVNSLIDWAQDEDADWIIFDDVDCVPTLDLQLNARNMIESCAMAGWDEIFTYRMFVLGQDRWFPKMNRAGQSLWAWKSNVNVHADEDSHTMTMHIPETSSLKLEHPYALLHYFYPDEHTFLRKKSQYLQTGEVDKTYDPMNQFGPISKLPDWARWK